MNYDWRTIGEGFAAGGFPWISQLKQLPIHLKLKNLDLAAIFNFFASLFASSVYAYCVYAHPTQVIGLPAWYWFITIAFALTALYVGLFLWNRTDAGEAKSLVTVFFSFLVYVGVFVSLTAGFGILKVFDPYVVIEGDLVDEQGRGVPDAEIDITDQHDYTVSGFSDTSGHFVVLIEKTKEKDITQAQISGTRGRDRQITFSSGFSAPMTMRRVVLRPAAPSH